MDYLHLNQNEKELVRRIAQNDPTMTSFPEEYGDHHSHLILALGHALIDNTFLCNLELTNLTLTEEAARALAQGMARSKIKSLCLDGSIEPEPQQQLPAPHQSDDNESAVLLLQRRICDILYQGIQATNSIQRLSLSQSLNEDPGNTWRDALLGITSVVVFALEGHGYVQAFSEVLSKATLLRELTIVLEGVEPDDMAILAQGLCQNESITSLDLVNDHVGSRPNMQILFAQGLNPKSSVTQLRANRCRIDDACIELLANHWLPNCPVKEMLLCENDISSIGAGHLVQALATHPTMTRLHLSGNTGIGYKGMRMIGNELANLQHLTYLDLHDCSTFNYHAEPTSMEAQAQTRARQHAVQALLHGIQHNLSITDLVLSSTGLLRDMEDNIEFYCTLNKMGRRHLLAAQEGHEVSPSVWCHVFTKLQNHAKFGASLLFFYLKEQPTLVQQY